MKFMLAIFTLLFAIGLNAQVFTSQSPNVRAYNATVRPFDVPANATDMCVITGSATKVIKIIGVQASSSQTTTGTNEIFLVKRTTANTGGATQAMSTVAFDTGIPAPTATAFRYLTNPTSLGTSPGALYVKRALSPVSTALGVQYFDMLDNSSSLIRPIVLRGAAESLALNFNGAAVPTAMAFNCTFEFVEE